MMFLDCPAYLDDNGATRCGLPAEVRRRVTMGSTHGPLDSFMIRCPSGHWFNAPLEFLTYPTSEELPYSKSIRPQPTARHAEAGAHVA